MVLAFDWESYRLADACLAMTPWEAKMIAQVFGAPRAKIHIVPNGVEEIFAASQAVQRGPWLVSTTTITPRKRVLELAQAAVLAHTPLWVIGKPYSETEQYARDFLQLAAQHPQTIRYQGAVTNRAKLAQIYREARGFVLLSAMESLSLSALEAAACNCPLLLSDLPWARTAFGPGAAYCPIAGPRRMARFVKEFYGVAPNLKPPPKPMTWLEVGKQLRGIYESLLKTSR